MALNPRFADGLNRLIGHKGRKDLRGENEIIEYTAEQEFELLQCMNDPVYFIKKYVKIVHVDRGFIPFEMYPFQEEIIRTVHENRFVIGKLPRQVGKCVYINTVVRCKSRITGEIYDTTIGKLFEMAEKSRSLSEATGTYGEKGEREERTKISRQVRRAGFRHLRKMWLKGNRPHQAHYEGPQRECQGIWNSIQPQGTGVSEGSIGTNYRKQEPGLSTWGNSVTVFKEICSGRQSRRNREEGRSKPKIERKRQNPDRLLDEEVEWRSATGTNDALGITENLYVGKMHSAPWGRGRSENLAESSRSLDGNFECQNRRRETRNQSQETTFWRCFCPRTGIVRNLEKRTPKPASSVDVAWNEEKLSIRHDTRQKNNRIPWRLLACEHIEISSYDYRSSSFYRSTNLGQGQTENRVGRIARLSSNGDLGIGIQNPARRNYFPRPELSDSIDRKFTASYDLNHLDIWADSGWVPATKIHQTIPYERWVLRTTDGKELLCADDHIVFRASGEQVFVKNLVEGDDILVEGGTSAVSSVVNTHILENMYDLTVDSEDHRYYTNGILSHNTTTIAAYILWFILFNMEKNVAILANKAATAREIMGRVQKAYEALPRFIQQGVKTWNKGSIELSNGSKVFADATSGSAVRGKSFAFILLDEFAHVENHLQEPFFTSTYPTITSGKETKVVIISTPKGLNMFYEIWMKSMKGMNEYKRVEVHWSEVPGRDQAWFDEQLRNTSEVQVAQEVLCEFLGSGNTLIAGSKLRILDAAWKEPLENRYHGNLRIYEKPIPGHTYAMCCDCATGQGGDAQAFQVIDVTEFPFKQVAAFADNRLYYMQYPTRIIEVANWYNEAFVLVEINDVGQAVSYILQVEIGYDNLIKIKPKGKQGQHISGGFQKMTQYGLKHNTATKRIGCNALKALIETDRLIINDFKTVEELKTFVENVDSFAADEGSPNAHDDLVMALVGFGWLSDQQFFKDAVGQNVRENLERQMKEIDDEDFTPFGFIVDGVNHTVEDVEDMVRGVPRDPWLNS